MRLNVLYEFSDSYAPYAGVSILSLLENNQDISDINIYVLDDGVSQSNKEKIAIIIKKYKRRIFYINTNDIKQMLIEYNVPEYKGSYATYYKLFAMKYLPSDVDKVLYLDSDTVITGSLKELITLELGNAPCAMVLDPIFDKYKDILKIGRDKKYFNCGMGLFNRNIWEKECESQILNLLKYEQSGFFIMDQDIINSLYSTRIIKLPLKYNLTGAFTLYKSDEIYYLYDYSEKTMYSKKEVEDAKQDPVVCHYIAYQAGRPWEIGNVHPMTPIFDKYLKLSPWKDLKKYKVNNNKMIKIQRFLYINLPRSLYLRIHKIILSLSMSKMAKKAERKVGK